MYVTIKFTFVLTRTLEHILVENKDSHLTALKITSKIMSQPFSFFGNNECQ